MKKKNKNELLRPMLAVIAVTLSVPMITHAAMAMSGPAPTTMNNAEPRLTGEQNFDPVEFRRLQRMQRLPTPDVVKPVPATTNTSSSVNPCDASSSSSSAPARARDFYDLSSGEQRDMLYQLELGGCPYDVDADYRRICEGMLKARGTGKSVRVGPRNPKQQ